MGARLFLGDAADDESYEEDSVLSVGAQDASGKPVACQKQYGHGRLVLEAPGANILWTKSDYGFWRKTTRGWSEGSKQDPGRTIASAWHLQYSKLVKNYQGPRKLDLELEIVLDRVSERHLEGTVWHEKKAAPNVPIYLGHKKVARTDKNGHFRFSKPKEKAVFSAVVTRPLKAHPDADKKILTCSYTLGAQSGTPK